MKRGHVLSSVRSLDWRLMMEYCQAVEYLTDLEARSLAIRFSRGVSLTSGLAGQRGVDFQVEVVMDDISLYFRVIDALASAYENRGRRRGDEDPDSDRLSQMG